MHVFVYAERSATGEDYYIQKIMAGGGKWWRPTVVGLNFGPSKRVIESWHQQSKTSFWPTLLGAENTVDPEPLLSLHIKTALGPDITRAALARQHYQSHEPSHHWTITASITSVQTHPRAQFEVI